jgi:chromosomal replication initiator protein
MPLSDNPHALPSTDTLSPDTWEKTMDVLRQLIGESNVRAWLSRSRFEQGTEANSYLLAFPNEFYRRWVAKRYSAAIESALEQVMGEAVRVDLVIHEDLESQTNGQPTNGRAASVHAAAAAQFEIFDDETIEVDNTPHSPSMPMRSRRPGNARPPESDHAAPGRIVPAYNRLNPRYVLDEFVVGESNRYAYAAATALSDPKGTGFHPLFIYGGTGLGKTHLMQGIGHRVLQMNNSLKVLYVTSEQFINHFIDSIQHRRSREFRSYYRNADMLFIDDVQFLMGKDKSQMEFFHTFNALCEAGKKVVVSSDRAPKDLQSLEDRLRSRFEWGLLVDIQPPDLETRIAILRKKAEADRIILPNDVAIYVAERVHNNVRELEGVLKRLRVYSSLHAKPIDLEVAREILGHLPASQAIRAIAIEDVQRVVCDYFQIRVSDLLGKNRSKKFSRPRHIAQYLCRKLTNLSFPDIAIKFGGKDHTSVIYACRKIESASRSDSAIASLLEHLESQVTRGDQRV